MRNYQDTGHAAARQLTIDAAAICEVCRDPEVAAALQHFDDLATVAATVLVHDCELDVTYVPRDRVAEEQEHEKRQQERERHAARIPAQLDHLLARHGE